MYAYAQPTTAPPETPAPPTRDKMKIGLIIGVALLVLTLIGTAVKIVQDSSTIDTLNASISTLEAENADLAEALSDTQSDLRASEAKANTLGNQVDQAETTIASYLICTEGLLKVGTNIANGSLAALYSANATMSSVKSDCVYALSHSKLAKSEFA